MTRTMNLRGTCAPNPGARDQNDRCSGGRGGGVGLTEAGLRRPLDVVALATRVRAHVADLLGQRVAERSRPCPELVGRSGRDEEVDDPGAGRAVDGPITDRALESVRPGRDLVGADPDEQILDLELDVTTAGTLCTDCRHRSNLPGV